MYVLRRADNSEFDEGDRAFARVYECTPGSCADLTKTSGIIIFTYTEGGGFFAEEDTNDSFTFVNAHENEGWRFTAHDLTDPAWIERIVDAFEAMRRRAGEWQYELYERTTQVAIVRSPNPDYIQPVAEKTASAVLQLICNDGGSHEFVEKEFSWSVGGRAPTYRMRFCGKCGAPICTNLARL